MRNLKIYLDTSVISNLFADDAPWERSISEELFATVVAGSIYECYISQIVIEELSNTPDDTLRAQLLSKSKNSNINVIDYSDVEIEVNGLAEQYIVGRAIPPAKIADALHVAITTIYEIDILLSWNYRHLANIEREARITGINTAQGYRHPVRITNPTEVLNARE